MEKTNQKEDATSSALVADILLVEDDPTDADLALRALKKCGFAHRVEHVSNGAEALEYIAATTLFAQKNAAAMPKLILLDLNMGKLGGLHVLRQLKSDELTKTIPIIVLTSSKLAIELVESYKFGVNSYVINPPEGKMCAEVAARRGLYWLVINDPPP